MSFYMLEANKIQLFFQTTAACIIAPYTWLKVLDETCQISTSACVLCVYFLPLTGTFKFSL